MEIDQGRYAAYLLCAIPCGVVLGAIYDVFRILRLARKSDKPVKSAETISILLTFCEDLLFSVIAAVFMAILTYACNRGRVRWFALASAGGGFIAYRLTVGRLVILSADAIISLLRRLFRLLAKIAAFPFVRLARFLIRRVTLCRDRNFTLRVTKQLIKEAKSGFLAPSAENQTKNQDSG